MSHADENAVCDALQDLARIGQQIVHQDPEIGNRELLARLKQVLPVEHALVFESEHVGPGDGSA